jgi:hypothetical protein
MQKGPKICRKSKIQSRDRKTTEIGILFVLYDLKISVLNFCNACVIVYENSQCMELRYSYFHAHSPRTINKYSFNISKLLRLKNHHLFRKILMLLPQTLPVFLSTTNPILAKVEARAIIFKSRSSS